MLCELVGGEYRISNAALRNFEYRNLTIILIKGIQKLLSELRYSIFKNTLV